MSTIQWFEGPHATATDFRINAATRRVTGALWLPAEHNATTPLMLCGHGASGDRYQAPIPHLARRFADAGIATLSIDGPVHGLRQVGPGGRTAFAAEMRRAECIDDMLADWHLAVGEVRRAHGLDSGPQGYFGLSMGTIFGIPLLASPLEFTTSAIGLCGATGAASSLGQRLLNDASRITHPLVYLMQLEDELFDREGYLQIFDALASEDKRLHANPGLHPEVPAEEVDFVVEFLCARLLGSVSRRIINPLAE